MHDTALSRPLTDTTGMSPETSTGNESRFATSLITTLASLSRPVSRSSISMCALLLRPEVLLSELSAGAQMSGGRQLAETVETTLRSLLQTRPRARN